MAGWMKKEEEEEEEEEGYVHVYTPKEVHSLFKPPRRIVEKEEEEEDEEEVDSSTHPTQIIREF